MASTQSNAQIADVLDRIAELLELDNANPFRVRAYRDGAQTIREQGKPVATLVKRAGLDELIELPNIGSGIAGIVGELIASGKSALLEELEAKSSPEDAFAKIPGIGAALAKRIVNKLHIETLPELEDAAQDGRLAEVEGFGTRRVEGVRAALAGMLSRSAQAKQRSRAAAKSPEKSREKSGDRPTVALLLDVDAEYRKKAKAGDLHKIAPRRFNPDNKAWLPVMQAKRDGWEFTAMFSNTAQAHDLGKTDDWVVIYHERDGKESQNTFVTETKGAQSGKRVVRGRERETG